MGRRRTAKTKSEVVSRQPGLIEQSTGVRLQPAAIPLLTSTVGIAAYSTLMHHVTATDPTTAALAAALHTGTTYCLSAFTWRHVGDRHRARQIASTATVAWHGTAATVLTAVGPWHWPWAMVWVAGSVVCGGYWVLRQWTRALGAEDGEAQHGGADQVAELAALSRAQISRKEITAGGTVRAQLALPPGQLAAKELAGVDQAVASLVDVPTSRTRIIPDSDRPRMATLEIDTVDHLAARIEWPGGSAVGADISVPVRAGRYGDGRQVMVHITGKDGVSDHLMVTGTTGAGKTDGVVGMVGDMLTRTQVNVLILDCVKPLQSWGHLAPYLWLEATEKRCRQIMRRLSRVVTDRTNYLGAKNLKAWEPGCGLNYLVVEIEEAYKLVAGGQYNDVAFAARSAGIEIITSMQRPTYDNADTSWRAQHTAFWCFGVRDSDDATYGLPDTLHGLVHPETWRNQRPGYSYLGGLGVSGEDELRPLRSYPVDGPARERMARYVSAWRTHLGLTGELDEVTAAAFGDLWTSRTVYPDPYAGQHPANPETLLPATLAAGDDREPTEDEGDDQADEVAQEIDEAAADLGEHLVTAAHEDLADLTDAERAAVGPVAAADPALAARQLPLDDDPDLAELDPAAGPLRGHGGIRSAWLAWVGELYRTGRHALDRPSAVAWAEQHDRSDSWADGQMAALVEAGDAHRHPDHRGVILLDREPADPLAELFAGSAV